MKNKNKFITGFVLLAGVVAVFGAAVVLRSRVEAPGMPEASDRLAPAGAFSLDEASIATQNANDDQVVQNASDGYSFAMPASWYLEKNDGSGTTVYPDYDPAGGVAPECKMEISSFPAATAPGAGGRAADLNNWLTDHLHADPTVDVLEISRTNVKLGTSSALEWRGSLNGVTTTLVYAFANGKILEIAPSSLDPASDLDADDCDLMLQAFMANLRL